MIIAFYSRMIVHCALLPFIFLLSVADKCSNAASRFNCLPRRWNQYFRSFSISRRTTAARRGRTTSVKRLSSTWRRKATAQREPIKLRCTSSLALVVFYMQTYRHIHIVANSRLSRLHSRSRNFCFSWNRSPFHPVPILHMNIGGTTSFHDS